MISSIEVDEHYNRIVIPFRSIAYYSYTDNYIFIYVYGRSTPFGISGDNVAWFQRWYTRWLTCYQQND